MNDNTFRGRAVPAEPQHGSGGEPLRPQPMSAEVIEAYEAGFKAGQSERAMRPHSPTPWHVEPSTADDEGNPMWHYICPKYREGDWTAVASTWNGAKLSDALHIVRCVNSHDALVEALEEIVPRLESAAAEVDCFNVYQARDVARAALAKAKEDGNAAA